MNHLPIAIIGGDLRFVRLCQLLIDKGHNVYVYGISHPDIPNQATICSSLEDVKKCKYIIAPIPFSKDNNTLFTPLSNVSISIEQFFLVANNSFVLLGALNNNLKLLFKKHNIQYKDLMDMDEAAILNAIPTAEGAIQYAMQNSEITLHDSQCLVLGFGRCGKILAHKLYGLGANVSVEARSSKDLAFISTYGYTPIPLKDLKNHLDKYHFIFNTIPAIVLDTEAIKKMSKDTVYIELASAPGGIDPCATKTLGINYIPAPSLPGKVAPKSAAKIIYHCFSLILHDMGEFL
ncbi:MAG TPA: dipicolinate synthase subunit DpsA [Erysipelotrichaceae bacterium]|nr:dipicolinate synthase subunit DpsA [Erysipelotrichaceae bacterium]